MIRTIPILFAAAILLLPHAAHTQAGQLTTAERLAARQTQLQTEQAARQQIENLFARLCPGRCELVELAVELDDPTPVGEVVPGFEAVAGQNFSADAKAINVTVLLDSKLPRNFQSSLPRMIRYRLANLAPTVNVRPELLNFPEPQLEPMPPYLPEPPQPRPEPLPQVEPLPTPEPAPVDATPAEPAPEPTFWDRVEPLLAAVAPWIGPLLMLLVFFALIMVLLRRMQEVTRNNGASAGSSRATPPVDVDALLAELNSSRAVRNAVLRKWLDEDADGVAQAVRLLGPEIVADLKSDAAYSAPLAHVSEIVAREQQPLTDAEVRATAAQAQARLTAARLVHDDNGLSMDWEFLEGLNPSSVRRILASCSVTEVAYVLGQLPPALRSAYLESLDANDRRQLVLGTTADVLSKAEALALAARLRRAADDVSHIGREADGQAALVLDMVHALQLPEQEEMLRELKGKRPELAEVVLGRIVLETTLLQLPNELTADAVHRVPVAELAMFLRGTRATVRDHVLSVAPASKRQAVMAELSLELPAGRAEFLAARERVLRVVLDAASRDGANLIRANSRALMSSNNINPVPDEASV